MVLQSNIRWLIIIVVICHVIGISRAVCTDYEFKCSLDGRCIPNVFKCDGEIDCGGGSDEENCDQPCEGNLYQCASGQCIGITWLCDGDPDCADGSDEIGCNLPRCKLGEFQCSDGVCISENWKCDNEQDCSDGSDESDCGPDPSSCVSEAMRCDSGECIHASWRCDGDPDCSDGSDEEFCENNPERPCRGGLCEFGATCEVIDGAARCVCPTCELDIHAPVCGTSYITYQNECHLKRASCRHMIDIQVKHRGMCDHDTTSSITTQTAVRTTHTGANTTPEMRSNLTRGAVTRKMSTTSTFTPTSRTTYKTTSSSLPQYRITGRLAGIINGKSLTELKLDSHVAGDGKYYVNVHPASSSDVKTLYPLFTEIASLIAWMLATDEGISGFAFTEGKCTRRTAVSFQSGENVTIEQKFFGRVGDVIDVHTYIKGTTPVLEPSHHVGITLGNEERYMQLHPGMIYSYTDRHMHIGNTSIKYSSEQYISFDAQSAAITMQKKDKLVMNLTDITVNFDNVSRIVRLEMRTNLALESGKAIIKTPLSGDPNASGNDNTIIYVSIGGVLLVALIVAVVVFILIRNRKKRAGVPNSLLSPTQVENRTYMDSVVLYEEIETEEPGEETYDYVDDDNNVTCNAACNGSNDVKNVNVNGNNRTTMNDYSDMEFKANKPQPMPRSLKQNPANGGVQNEKLTERVSVNNHYLTPCSNDRAQQLEEDGYMRPKDVTKQ